MRTNRLERRLVRRAKKGDRAGFAQLYDLYYAPVYALAYGALRERNAAAGVLQETFAAAWTNLSGLPRTEPFGRWVQRICFQCCDAYLRSTGRASELTDPAAQELLADADPDTFRLPQSYTVRPELKAHLEHVLSTLPDRQRRALTLYYNNGLDETDTAAVMGVHPVQVRMYLAGARREIIRRLGEQERASGQMQQWQNAAAMEPFDRAMQAYMLSGMIAGGVVGLILNQIFAGSAAGGAAAAGTASGVSTGTVAATSMSTGPATSVTTGTASSVTSGTAVSTTVGTAAGVSTITKVVAGVTATALVAGGGYGVHKIVQNNRTPEPTTPAVIESLPEELLVQTKTYAPSPSFLSQIETYEYDENCLVVQLTQEHYDLGAFIQDGVEIVDGQTVYDFSYDADGRILSVTKNGKYAAYPGEKDMECTYDEGGRITKIRYASYDTLVKVDYTYNDQGKLTHLDAAIGRTSGTIFDAENSGSWSCEDNGNEIIMTGDNADSPNFVQRYDELGRETAGFDFWRFVPATYTYPDYPGINVRERTETIYRESLDRVESVAEMEFYFADAAGRVVHTNKITEAYTIDGEPSVFQPKTEFDGEGHLTSALFGSGDVTYTEFYYAETKTALGGAPEPASAPKDTAWKDAYLQYLQQMQDEAGVLFSDYSFDLLYIDDDDIPEMLIYKSYMIDGGELCTYSDGAVQSVTVQKWGVSYLERGNVIVDAIGRNGSESMRFYTIRNGTFVETGHASAIMSETDPDDITYSWNDMTVSRETYEAEWNRIADPARTIHPETELHDYATFVTMVQNA